MYPLERYLTDLRDIRATGADVNQTAKSAQAHQYAAYYGLALVTNHRDFLLDKCHAAAARIDPHCKRAHPQSFAHLLREGSPLEGSPDLVFTYDPEEYPAPVNSLYKGAHLYTGGEEKRTIGKLWEKRSQGKCLFVMPADRRFDMLTGCCL